MMQHVSIFQSHKLKVRDCTQNSQARFAGVVQFPAVKLQADDGKHKDGKEEQQADLQQRNHGLHDRLQDNLQTWEESV